MTKKWIETREPWFKGNEQETQKIEPTYSVREVCEIFKVTKGTVYKWLMDNGQGESAIDRKDWFKLPSGDIRIKRRAVIKLMEG